MVKEKLIDIKKEIVVRKRIVVEGNLIDLERFKKVQAIISLLNSFSSFNFFYWQ